MMRKSDFVGLVMGMVLDGYGLRWRAF